MPNAASSSDESRSGSGPLIIAAVIGFLGIPVIAFMAHWFEVSVNGDNYRGGVIINAMAPFVFVLFFGVILVLNPLLHRFCPRFKMGLRELVLIASMWLLSTAVSYKFLVLPVMHAIGDTAVLVAERAPLKRADMGELIDPTLSLPLEAAKQYQFGTGDGSHFVDWKTVPWSQWLGPLKFWLPLMLVVVVFVMSLVRMMHNQWSKHELLTFPIAEFGRQIMETDGRAWPRICYDRVFWLGVGVAAFIYIINGLHQWFPLMIEIPLSYRHVDLLKEFPFLKQYCGREAYSLFRGMVYLFVVSIAVLLPSEISLTCWGAWVLMIYFTGFHFLATGEIIGTQETTHMQTGMYVALLFMILYIGRREYWAVLKHACKAKLPAEEPMRGAAIACRTFLCAFVMLTVLVVQAGVEWPLAIVLVASFALVMLLVARMTAEVGFPWLPDLQGLAASIPLKLLGGAALGPKALAAIAVLSVVFGANLANSVAAQETTINKLGDDAGRRGSLFNGALLLGLVLAISASTVVSLWHGYSFGGRRDGAVSRQYQQKMEGAAREINRLKLEGAIADPNMSSWQRLRYAQAEPKFWRYFIYGCVAIAVCGFMRLRFTWWPFHPLPLILINTWALSRLYVSFFVGWLIKTIIVKIWGGRVFQRAKPFFIGIIAGQIMVFGLWLVVAVCYYINKGTQPPLIWSFL